MAGRHLWRRYFRFHRLSGISRPRPLLGTEWLESRDVPATFTVTNGLDSGTGSLRDAIGLANFDATTTDTIDFDPSVTQIDLASGELALTSNMDIMGPTGSSVRILRSTVASTNFRIFNVSSGAQVNLQNLSIQGGDVLSLGQNGGGIFNAGTLSLQTCVVLANSAFIGGGIFNVDGGNLTLTSSQINNNTSTLAGGGIYNNAGGVVNLGGAAIVMNSNSSGVVGGASGDGGAIYNAGDMTLTNGDLSGNSTINGSGGGIWNSGTFTLANGNLNSNTAALDGGGILISSGVMTITGSSITNNTSSANNGRGGGIVNFGTATIDESVIASNSTAFNGGGIFNSSSLTVTNSTIAGNNAASNGGGIFNNDTLTITNSTIDSNIVSEGDGGGIYNGPSSTATITQSTISNNQARTPKGINGYGGGLINTGTLTLTDSTIAGNSSDFLGGGIENQASLKVINSTIANNIAVFQGGGIDNGGSNLLVINSTIVGNNSIEGAGIYSYTTVTLNNTIVAKNTGGGGDLFTAGSGGTYFGSFDFIGDGRADSLTNTLSGDPLLGPLQNNGGPTQTMALLSGSPAIDAGNNSLAVDDSGFPLFTDQTGVALRIINGIVDMGALESRTIVIVPDLTATEQHVSTTPVIVNATLQDTTDDGSSTYNLEFQTSTGVFTLNAAAIGQATSNGISITGINTGDLILSGGSRAVLQDLISNASYGIAFVPPLDFDGEIPFKVNFSKVGSIGTATTNAFVDVAPVATPLNLQAPAQVSGKAGTSIPLQITVTPSPETDGTETTQLQITGVPSDVSLSAGTFDTMTGIWTIDDTQIAGLQILLPTDGRTFSLDVTALRTDVAFFPAQESSQSDSISQQTSIRVTSQVSSAQVIAPTNLSMNENTTLTLSGASGFQITDGNATPTGIYQVQVSTTVGQLSSNGSSSGVTITPDPNGISFSLTGTLSDLNAYLSNVGFTLDLTGSATRYYSGEAPVTLSLTDPNGFPGSGTSVVRVLPKAENLCLFVDPFASGPFLSQIPLSISTDPILDPDGSETTFVELSGFPAFSAFSAGFFDDATGHWIVPGDQLANLQFFPFEGFSGTFVLNVTLHIVDTANYPSYASPLNTARDEILKTGAITVTGRGFDFPAVTIPPQLTANEGQALSYQNQVNVVAPSSDPAASLTVTVNLPELLAKLEVPAGSSLPFTLSPDGRTLTLIGDAATLNTFFASSGFSVVTTDPNYSGPVTVTIKAALTSDANKADFDGSFARFEPVASTPILSTVSDAGTPLSVDSSGRIPAGSITMTPWPDQDGSESSTLSFQLFGVSNPSLFNLTSSLGTVVRSGTSSWSVTTITQNPADLQAILDSLTLLAPSGYNGTLSLFINQSITDTADFPAECLTRKVVTTGSAFLSIRYFLGTSISATPVTFNEGGVGDLGPAFILSDPDATPPGGPPAANPPGGSGGPNSTAAPEVDIFRIIAPRGLFRVNNLPSTLTVVGDGTGDLQISGPIVDLQNYLAQSGSLIYDPNDPHFAGQVVLSASLVNSASRLPPATTTQVVSVLPIATLVTATTTPVEVSSGSTAPVSIVLSPDPDPDSRETVDIFIDNVEGSFSAGTNLGNGTWQFTPADLVGLMYTAPVTSPVPPVQVRIFPVRVVVTDRVMVGSIQQSDTKSSETSLAVTITNFQPPTVTLPIQLVGPENTPLPITGLVFQAPNVGSGSVLVTLTVSNGVLTLNNLPSGFSIGGNSTSTVMLLAPLDAINAYFADSQSLVYDPPTFFAGAATFLAGIDDFINNAKVSSPLTLLVLPVAEPVQPTVSDATGFVNSDIPLSITVPALQETDGTETAVIRITGVPTGATLNQGTEVDGVWLLQRDQLAGLTIRPPLDFAGVITLGVSVQVVDLAMLSTGGTLSDVFTSPVRNLNVTVILPSISLSNATIPENSPTETVVGVLQMVNPNPDVTYTFQRVSFEGYDFTVDPDGSVRVGTQPLDFERLSLSSLTVSATDSNGNSVTMSFTITVTDVNEPPTVIAPSTLTTSEDLPLVLNGIAISDPEASRLPNSTVEVTIQSQSGSLALMPTSLPVSVSGIGTRTLSLLGRLSDLNSLLSGSFLYTPTQDFSGFDQFQLTVNDLDSGDPRTANASITVTVLPVADTPTVSVADSTGNQDTPIPLTISGVTTDIDVSESLTIVIQNLPAGSSLNQGTDLGNGSWQLTPSQLTGLTFLPPAGFSGQVPLTVEFVVTDSIPNAFFSDSLSLTRSLNITVTPVVPPPPTILVVTVPPPLAAPPMNFVSLDSSFLTMGSGTTGTSGMSLPSNPVIPVQTSVAGAQSFGGTGSVVQSLTQTDAATIQRSSTSRYGPVVLDAPQVAQTSNRTFAGGRERHPLPTVLPLDPTLPTAGFGESGGDNITTIERLLERATPAPGSPPPPAAPTAPTAPESPPATLGSLAPTGTEPAETDPAPVSDSPWKWTRISLASALALSWALLAPATKSGPSQRKQNTLKDVQETE